MSKYTDKWWSISTQAEFPYQVHPVMVLKRVGVFKWIEVDVCFDSVEDAQAYIEFADLLEVS